MKGQTGMYGVLLSECCTDRHRQHARRGLDGSAAVAAGGRLQQKNGITRHILWEAAAAAVTQRQQRQALHKIILLLYYLLWLLVLHSRILARSLSHARKYP